MRRRECLAGMLFLGLGREALGQPARKVYRIAVVHPSFPVTALTENGGNPPMEALFQELRRIGYVEGQNLVVERYSGEGKSHLSRQLAQQVLQRKPDLVVAFSRRLIEHFAAVGSDVPIIAGSTLDPVAHGFARSLARPGGNITGFVTDAGLEGLTKHIELLREAVPHAKRIGWLAPTETWNGRYGQQMKEAARRTGVSLIGPGLDSPLVEAEYRRVLNEMAKSRADAVVIGLVVDNLSYVPLAADVLTRLKLPAICPDRRFAEAGGLMAYALDYVEHYRRIPTYIDRILRGEKAGDLPFQQPNRWLLIVNLKAAKALGIALPESLLALADEIIE
jgi:putative tryptophan/tyrosine transport system substrate-binding protein